VSRAPLRAAAAERRIEDPLRVLALLGEAIAIGSLEIRLIDDGAAPVRAEWAKLQDTKHFLVRAPLPPSLELGDVLQTTFELHGTSFEFAAAILGFSGSEEDRVLTLKLPRTLTGTRRRRSVRFRPNREQLIGVEVEPPFGGPLETRTVVNLTTQGLAFQVDRRQIFPIGSILPRVRLRFPDGTGITCRARVRSLSPYDGALKCGVEFDTVTRIERARLADAIVHAGQPEIQDVTGQKLERIWDLFVRSGFLYPEKIGGLDVARVEQTMSALMTAPGDVFKGSLFVKDDQPYAHISALRAFRNTWIIHHLAATVAGRQRVSLARLLNLAIMEYLEQQPDIEWIRVYYRPENPWPARTLGTFARRVSDSSLSSLRILHYLRGGLVPALVAPSPGLRIFPAGPRHLEAVEAYFVAQHDHIALRAEDLCAPYSSLVEVSDRYRAAGLERRREILVAERDGALSGFALLEVSSAGLNLSELTSSFRVFMCRPDREAQGALIARSRARYAELGRRFSVALAESDELGAFADAGMEATKRYAVWTWHRSLYRQFFEYILSGLHKEIVRASESPLSHGEQLRVGTTRTEDGRPRIVA
jgi:hypothetical protein